MQPQSAAFAVQEGGYKTPNGLPKPAPQGVNSLPIPNQNGNSNSITLGHTINIGYRAQGVKKKLPAL